MPELSASSSASSSTMPPRAQLMMRTPLRIIAKAAAPTMPRVSSVNGACTVMKSERLKSSSRPTSSIPARAAASAVRIGSKPITFILRPAARSATMRPILPRPITPSVLLHTSTPVNLPRSHLPARSAALAAGICRAIAIIIVMVCSAVVMLLPSGLFITTMPRRVAASRSTLSTPTPARPITLSEVAASMISRVTLVALRITNAS